MSQVIRYQPASEFLSLREAMNRLFEDSYVGARAWNSAATWIAPTLDVYETPENVVVKAVVPGIKPEDVDITVTGNVLTLTGEAKEETETKEKNYLRRETRIGSFSRTLELPVGLVSDKADAKFENGVVTITLPKAEEVKPKTIKVKATGNGNPPKN
jgi:HSP20 family protein